MTSSLHTLALDTQPQNKADSYFHHQQFPVEYTDKFDFHITAPTQLPPLDLDHAHAHAHAHALFNNSNPQDDLMHPNSWDLSQLASRLGRFSHQREPSLSSLASSGPVSPFLKHLSNPHISFNDLNGDAIMDMHGHELPINPGGSCYQMTKPLDSYQNYQPLDNTGVSEMAYPVTISGPMSNQRHRLDRSLLPAPEFVSGSSRSHPASVASSVAGDSPATPTVGEADSGDRRRQGYNAPKLDRTMTDVYGDELYSPNFTITSSSPAQPNNVPVMSNNGVFNQRISAANTQHLSAAHHSPSTVSRDISPFRHGSPLAPSPSHEWINRGNMQLNPAQRMREQNKARRDARVAQQKQQQQQQQPQPPHQHQRQKSDFATPQTISPKDAMLDFNDADEDTQLPLFPPNSTDFGMDHLSSAVHGTGSFSTGNKVDFTTQPQLPATIHIPQRYPFVAQSHPLRDVSLPRHSSRDSNSTRAETQTPVQGRPANVGADSGTYTCTYHGCTLRFETPSLLQKHKREGHRQTHGLGGVRHQETSMAPGVMNSQAGPHRCDRINPSTGKPCNTIFSRPYDLTRHEDTIHNARKQKVHCNLCTEDKTFSRADALTRHFRVCHPDVELPGKHRRRGGS